MFQTNQGSYNPNTNRTTTTTNTTTTTTTTNTNPDIIVIDTDNPTSYPVDAIANYLKAVGSSPFEEGFPSFNYEKDKLIEQLRFENNRLNEKVLDLQAKLDQYAAITEQQQRVLVELFLTVEEGEQESRASRSKRQKTKETLEISSDDGIPTTFSSSLQSNNMSQIGDEEDVPFPSIHFQNLSWHGEFSPQPARSCVPEKILEKEPVLTKPKIIEKTKTTKNPKTSKNKKDSSTNHASSQSNNGSFVFHESEYPMVHTNQPPAFQFVDPQIQSFQGRRSNRNATIPLGNILRE